MYKSILLSAILGTPSFAQLFPFPENSGEIKCDGAIRPDYGICSDVVIPKTFGGATVGPGFAEGSTFEDSKCRIRVLRCGGSTDSTFEVKDVSSMYSLIRNECGEFPAGGSYRSGDACVLVDTPGNPLKEKKRATLEIEREAKTIRRNLVAEARDVNARCDPPPGPCYRYNEGTFITNVRGPQQRVCGNILPNGASCDKTVSVTTGESFSISTDIGTGIKDIVSVSAGFTSQVSSSSTESLTTSIKVDCPNGGYIVWYPLMQVSRGECSRGPRATCDGGCITDTLTQCEFRKPIQAGDNILSGEYDVQCI